MLCTAFIGISHTFIILAHQQPAQDSICLQALHSRIAAQPYATAMKTKPVAPRCTCMLAVSSNNVPSAASANCLLSVPPILCCSYNIAGYAGFGSYLLAMSYQVGGAGGQSIRQQFMQ